MAGLVAGWQERSEPASPQVSLAGVEMAGLVAGWQERSEPAGPQVSLAGVEMAGLVAEPEVMEPHTADPAPAA
jgi:hypothetical protein